MPAASAFDKPSKKSKRIRSITPEGGLKPSFQHGQDPYWHVQPSEGLVKAESVKTEPGQLPGTGAVHHARDSGTKEEPFMHQLDQSPNQDLSQQLYPSNSMSDGQPIKHEDGMREMRQDLSGRVLPASQSLPTSSAENGNAKKTGLKIKLKVR